MANKKYRYKVPEILSKKAACLSPEPSTMLGMDTRLLPSRQ
jgi:hypothetical protein